MTAPTVILGALLACLSEVSIEGDPSLAAEVRRELADREAGGSCTPLRATIERAGKVLLLQLADGQGHHADRSLYSTSAAAAVIASWAHLEIAPAVATAPRAEPQPAQLAPPAPSSGRLVAFARAEGSAASDGGLFAGALLGTGLGFGVLRPQILLRLMAEPGAPGHFSSITSNRTDVEALGSLATTVVLGSLLFRPYAAVGIGRTQATRPDGFDRYSVAARIEGGTSLTLTAGSLPLEIAGSLSFTPLARTFAAISSADASLPAAQRSGRALPGEPTLVAHLGLGASYEVR